MAGAGETGKEPSPWTIDSLHEKVNDLSAAYDRRMDERLEALTALLSEADRRYEQRFIAQENAVGLALSRVDKEFHEHLAQVRAETHAALEAADKAISKSEAATEKRFESVNEFRAQLADQAQRFIPRIEAEQRMVQNAEKIDALDTRHQKDVGAINSRLDLTTGRTNGIAAGWGAIVAAVGVVGAVIAIIIAVAP